MNKSISNLKDFLELLEKEVVIFYFRKKNGSVRSAYGTIADKFIPADKKPKVITNVAKDSSVILFFDVENQNWRSFKSDLNQVIGIVDSFKTVSFKNAK